jgi:hypothetical protein
LITALWLLAVQGVLGAFDTLYYHEWRARLPGGWPGTRTELALHAARDAVYVLLFGTLPWLRWQGLWALVLALLVAAEIVITLADFVVEDTVRRPLGGVYAGERITHAVMGILYGAVLAHLVPEVLEWWHEATALAFAPVGIHPALQVTLAAMTAGLIASGARDAVAAAGGRR